MGGLIFAVCCQFLIKFRSLNMRDNDVRYKILIISDMSRYEVN